MKPDTLLERAQEMDELALAQLHDRYYPAVYRYVRYRLEDEQVVEDISSDVFLRLLDHFHHRKGEIHDLRAWLLGTAANLINDHLRQRYRKPLENIDDHETLISNRDAENDPQQRVEHLDRQHEMQKALQQLTREQQHVLALRFTQGFSIEETAEMMNKTIGAVKVLQFRAIATLRKWLDVHEGVR